MYKLLLSLSIFFVILFCVGCSSRVNFNDKSIVSKSETLSYDQAIAILDSVFEENNKVIASGSGSCKYEVFSDKIKLFTQ